MLSYGRVISRNVRAARAALTPTLKQASLASRMSALGFPWHPQTVGAVERSERRVTAEEILGLALALETTITTLMAPIPQDRAVELAGGSVDVDAMQGLAMGYYLEPISWDGDVPVFPTPETPRKIREEAPWRLAQVHYDKMVARGNAHYEEVDDQ